MAKKRTAGLLSFILALGLAAPTYGTEEGNWQYDGTVNASDYGKKSTNGLIELLSAPQTLTAQARNMTNLVIFINFAGEPGFTENDLEEYKNIFKILNSYYQEVSYGQTFINSILLYDKDRSVFSYQDPNPQSYYLRYNENINPMGYKNQEESRNRELAMLEAALEFAQPYIPVGLDLDLNGDNLVDALTFIVNSASEAGTPLYPHKTTLAGSKQAVFLNDKIPYAYNVVCHQSFKLGTLIHEIYHVYGGPDLYLMPGANEPLESPVGKWDIGSNAANPAQNMTIYTKWKYGGWIEEIKEITASGTYSLRPSSLYPDGFKISIPGSQVQNFYLEFRDPTSAILPYRFEGALPGAGLLIMRGTDNLNGNYFPALNELYILREKDEPNNIYSAYRTKGDIVGRGQDRATGFPLLYYALDPADTNSSDATLAVLDTVKIEVTDVILSKDKGGTGELQFEIAFAHSLTTGVNNTDWGSILVACSDKGYESDGKVLCGENITITSNAKEGCHFNHWEGEGILLTIAEAAEEKLSFQMPDNEVRLTAVFESDINSGYRVDTEDDISVHLAKAQYDSSAVSYGILREVSLMPQDAYLPEKAEDTGRILGNRIPVIDRFQIIEPFQINYILKDRGPLVFPYSNRTVPKGKTQPPNNTLRRQAFLGTNLPLAELKSKEGNAPIAGGSMDGNFDDAGNKLFSGDPDALTEMLRESGWKCIYS